VSSTSALPPGCDIRLCSALFGDGWSVLVAVLPLKAEWGNLLLRPGSLSAALTHDPGVSWPDRPGIQMAAAILRKGGVVSLEFASLGDALQCEARLRREMSL
jgi:hypothetical protein